MGRREHREFEDLLLEMLDPNPFYRSNASDCLERLRPLLPAPTPAVSEQQNLPGSQRSLKRDPAEGVTKGGLAPAETRRIKRGASDIASSLVPPTKKTNLAAGLLSKRTGQRIESRSRVGISSSGWSINTEALEKELELSIARRKVEDLGSGETLRRSARIINQKTGGKLADL